MNVKTTKIEKKYKDKKTGEYKSLTINHAKVKDRLKAFWEGNPMGKIETSSLKEEDGVYIFKTFILADKSNPASREATGHARGEMGGDKDFEKLETISVGRALALLGYATDGEVASFEEMEDFLSDKEKKRQEKIQEIKDGADKITDIAKLRKFFSENKGYGAEVDAYIIERSKLLQETTPKK